MISIAVFAPINSDKKNNGTASAHGRLVFIRTCGCKNNFIRKHRPKLFCICNRQRKKAFSGSLSECDIVQGEAILSKIKSYQGSEVAVLSSADQYGKTFFEWIPFQASQLGIKVTDNIRYKTKNTSSTDSSQTGTEALSLDEVHILKQYFQTFLNTITRDLHFPMILLRDSMQLIVQNLILLPCLLSRSFMIHFFWRLSGVCGRYTYNCCKQRLPSLVHLRQENH